MSVVYRLTQDNRKESKTKGKWYARALHTGVIDIEGLANIMQANCTLKKSDILAVIAELVDVMRAQLQNSQKVVLDGLGSFKVGLKTKPADTSTDFYSSKKTLLVHECSSVQPATPQPIASVQVSYFKVCR